MDLKINDIHTSFFHYDLDFLDQHLANIKANISDNIKLWYACKANPLSYILQRIVSNGYGLDVASEGELSQALKCNASEIIATGPAKSKEYIERLFRRGVKCLVAESPNQLKWANETAQSKNGKWDVLLRLQIEWGSGKSVLGGDAITPFGVGAEQWLKVKIEDYPYLNIIGIHTFQWGNLLDEEKIISIWNQSFLKARLLANQLGFEMEVLDLGGGLGVPYTSQQKPLDIAYLLRELSKIGGLGLKKWLELGRYAVAECGSYFTKIVDIKENRGKRIVVTEGGINHIARPALTQQPFRCNTYGRKGDTQRFLVHGPLCTALDFLGEFELSEKTAIGDWLQFDMTGAYGFTESMPYFLCHQLPAEYVTKDGEMVRVREALAPKDYMR